MSRSSAGSWTPDDRHLMTVGYTQGEWVVPEPKASPFA